MKTYWTMKRMARAMIFLGMLLSLVACSTNNDGGPYIPPGECGTNMVWDASGNCVCAPFYTLQPDGSCAQGSGQDDDDDDDDNTSDGDNPSDDDDDDDDDDVTDPCQNKVCGTNAHCESGNCVCDTGFSGDPNTACERDGDGDEDGDTEAACTCPAPPQAIYCVNPEDINLAGFGSVSFGPGPQSGCNVSIRILNLLGEETAGGVYECDANGDIPITGSPCVLGYRDAQQMLVLTCGTSVYRFSQDYAPCDGSGTDGDTDRDEENDPACLNVVCGTHAHCEGGDCFCDPGYSGNPDVACSLPADGDIDVTDGDTDGDTEGDSDGDTDGDTDGDLEETTAPCNFDADCGAGRYCWILTDPNECRCQCGEACGNAECDSGMVCNDHGQCVMSQEDGDIEEEEGFGFGHPCTEDEQCQMGLYCRNSACGYDCNPPTLNCSTMAYCDSRGRCQLDMCFGQPSPPCCNRDADCPAGRYCGSNSCTYDCLAEGVCSGNTCCSLGMFCNTHGQCEDGELPDGDATDCTAQTEASVCHPLGMYCDPQYLICVKDCENAEDCYEGEVCEYGECVTDEPGCMYHEMCNVGFKCDMDGSAPTYECVPGCPTVDVCEGMYVCNGHICVYNTEIDDDPPSCDTTSDCPVYYYCPEEESHPNFGWCSQDCNPSDPDSCSDGQKCLLNGKCGVCSDFADCPQGQFCGCPPPQMECAMEEQICIQDGCQTDTDCASQGYKYCCREGLTYGTSCTPAQYGQCVYDCSGNFTGCNEQTQRCNEIGICEDADTCPGETDEECEAGTYCNLQTRVCVQDCNAETPCVDEIPDDDYAMVCDFSIGRCYPVPTCLTDEECQQSLGAYHYCDMDEVSGLRICQSSCTPETVLEDCLEGEICSLEGRCVANECEADWECACSFGQDPTCSRHEYCQELAEGGRICTFECRTNADCPNNGLCDYNGICHETQSCDAATYCQPVLPLNPPPAEHDYPYGGGIMTYCDTDAGLCTYDCTDYAPFGGTCAEGAVCMAGHCAECRSNDDCPTNYYCEYGTFECKFLALCDSSQADPDATCKAIDPGLVCVADRCERGCSEDDDCVTEGDVGYCRVQTCGDGEHCPSYCAKDCTESGDCVANQYCNAYGRCTSYQPPW